MTIVTTYRYMWLKKDDEKLYIDVFTGTEEAHEMYISDLEQRDDIVNVCRVYVQEIDLSKVEEYETIFDRKECEENA